MTFDVTYITAYQDSPRRVPLFERWMKQQTFKGSVQWIVVDDGDEPAPLTMGQQHLRRKRLPSDPDHTLGMNLRHALAHVQSDKVLFIETDDYYSPQYVEIMVDWLNRYPIAGTSFALKYNVRDRRWWRNTSAVHSSLCSTGIRSILLPTVNEISVTHNPFLDLELWHRHGKDGYLVPSFTPGWPVLVGIKCLPGRTSKMTMNGRISRMGRATNGHPDPQMMKLHEWIGDDAFAYAEFGQ